MTAAKRKPGRPKSAEPRSNRSIKFSDPEWARVQEQAKAAGVTAAAWVRSRCGL